MTTTRNFFQNLLKPFTSTSTREEQEEILEEIVAKVHKNFSFDALVAATQNFHASRKLGQGGFGPVFQGKLSDGREIAVKRLSRSSGQGKDEFLNEAKLLSLVQHRNVVNLLGYCVRGPEKLLVYEYVANQSLDKFLFKSEKRALLDWKRRHDVLTGVAKGLLYLHEQAHCTIIHRDIKASNILLDDNWVPKIADFGMARLFPEDQSQVQTRIAGTNGYMAPEYLMSGSLSKKADVFSFGVVALELISGQRNSSFNRDPDSGNLLEWAYKLYKKQRIWEIIDPVLLVSSADMEQIAMVVHIGLLCVQFDPHLRPAMDRVVVLLSRRPSHLEEPSTPRLTMSGYRMTTRPSSSGNSSSGSFGSIKTQTASSTTSSLASSNPPLHRHGKRPVTH